jgi:Ran GTPase-activating protein 1
VDFSDMFTGRLKTMIPVALTALAEALFLRPLETLNLEDNAIGAVATPSLVPLLSTTRYLRHINLTNCGMSAESCKVFVDGCLTNPLCQIESVSIARNRFHSEGAAELARLCSGSSVPKNLDVSSCSISEKGFTPLLEAILAHPVDLKSLKIQDNNLSASDDGPALLLA